MSVRPLRGTPANHAPPSAALRRAVGEASGINEMWTRTARQPIDPRGRRDRRQGMANLYHAVEIWRRIAVAEPSGCFCSLMRYVTHFRMERPNMELLMRDTHPGAVAIGVVRTATP
jgi:hypothetical protein